MTLPPADESAADRAATPTGASAAEEATDASAAAEAALKERVELFLLRNFPQIQMHGGSASVLVADPERGHVHVALGGACSGCGISPMTVQAVQRRLVSEFPEVDTVETETGAPADSGGFDRDEVPF